MESISLPAIWMDRQRVDAATGQTADAARRGSVVVVIVQMASHRVTTHRHSLSLNATAGEELPSTGPFDIPLPHQPDGTRFVVLAQDGSVKFLFEYRRTHRAGKVACHALADDRGVPEVFACGGVPRGLNH
jgi:hypothetical protein